MLWEEYRGGTGAQDGFGYSWFCDLYREWVGRLKPTLRQVHTAGERIFVDFAGHAMEVIDGATGEVRRAEIFVAVLGGLDVVVEVDPAKWPIQEMSSNLSSDETVASCRAKAGSG